MYGEQCRLLDYELGSHAWRKTGGYSETPGLGALRSPSEPEDCAVPATGQSLWIKHQGPEYQSVSMLLCLFSCRFRLVFSFANHSQSHVCCGDKREALWQLWGDNITVRAAPPKGEPEDRMYPPTTEEKQRGRDPCTWGPSSRGSSASQCAGQSTS